MDKAKTDTIAAIATPPGKGGVGIVRVSGPLASHVALCLLGKIPPVRVATFSPFYNPAQEIIDSGLALYFKAPHSFTGEDVLELQGHGGPVVMDMLLEAVLGRGVRMAEPGEFSLRAFLQGKMDLTQCEAVADLIDAGTQQAAISATRSLQGVFSTKIQALAQDMMALRRYVEASIDFPDEEVDFLHQGEVLEKLEALIRALQNLLQEAKQGQLLREGLLVVMAGLPNAGKSSVLNALTGQNTAIVTPYPGTTRDLIKESIQIAGVTLHIVDTAGIREEADPVEAEGIKRAKTQWALADHILWIKDVSQASSVIENDIIHQYPEKITEVWNKIDLMELPGGYRQGKWFISAKTGEGIDAVQELVQEWTGRRNTEHSTFMARRRHLVALEKALLACEAAKEQLCLYHASELVAQELQEAHHALGEIIGKITPDHVLENIFSNFCIGK